jgi:hypothetical protein
MSDTLKKFLAAAQAAYGDNLRSVILYGSQAGKNEADRRSDYNLLFILDHVDTGVLTALRGVMHSWTKQGNLPPLIFSRDMLLRSCDVFPMEFLDMQEQHVMLLGEDPFPALEIHLTYLRHQCEFELKGKLLKLRQAYMAAAGDARVVRDLLIASIGPFLIVFRHVLRLYGELPPLNKEEALDRLAGRCAVNPDVFHALLRIKRGDRTGKTMDAETVMDEYLLQLEKIISCVDQLVLEGGRV